MEKIRKDWSVILTFFLLDRSVQGIPFIALEWFNPIYVNVSKLLFLLIFVRFFAGRVYDRRFNTFIILLFVSFAFLFISTIFNGGDIMRYFSMFYPIVGIVLYSINYCTDYRRTSTFLYSVSLFYYALVFLNLIFVIVDDSMFGVSEKGGYTFFLGGENLIGYPLLLGFLSNSVCNQRFNFKRQYYTYLAMFCATNLIVFSGATVSSAFLVLLASHVNYVRKFVTELSGKVITLLGTIACTFLVVGFSYIEHIPYMNVLIENTLGKDFTFTGRTFIWSIVVPKIAENPIFGYGVQETMNLFYVHESRIGKPDMVGTYSAHNQFLQSTYEGGLVYLFVLLIGIYYVFHLIDIASDTIKMKALIKSVCMGVILMYFFEAPGIHIVWTIMLICLLSTYKLKTYDHVLP